MTIDTHPFLLETLINNPLSNTIRHSPAGGYISITLASNQLIFTNSVIKFGFRKAVQAFF